MAFTIGLVAHQAWGAAIAREPATLSRLFGYREIAVIAGILGTFIATALAEHWFGSSVATKAHSAGAFILVSLVLCTLITCIFTSDPVSKHETANQLSFARLRPFLFSNGFVRLFIATAAFDFGWVSYSVLGYFSARHLFAAPDKFALALATTFVVAPIGMAIWMRTARLLGDQRTLVIGCLYTAASFASLPLLTPFGARGLLAFSALLGIGFGAGPYLLRALTGAISNRFEVEHGASVRGVAFAATTFAGKAGSGCGAAALILVSWLGFDPKLEVDSGAMRAILVAATGLPVLGLLICTFSINWAKLSEPA